MSEYKGNKYKQCLDAVIACLRKNGITKTSAPNKHIDYEKLDTQLRIVVPDIIVTIGAEKNPHCHILSEQLGIDVKGKGKSANNIELAHRRFCGRIYDQRANLFNEHYNQCLPALMECLRENGIKGGKNSITRDKIKIIDERLKQIVPDIFVYAGRQEYPYCHISSKQLGLRIESNGKKDNVAKAHKKLFTKIYTDYKKLYGEEEKQETGRSQRNKSTVVETNKAKADTKIKEKKEGALKSNKAKKPKKNGSLSFRRIENDDEIATSSGIVERCWIPFFEKIKGADKIVDKSFAPNPIEEKRFIDYIINDLDRYISPLRNGDIVEGIVIDVKREHLVINLKRKKDGIVPRRNCLIENGKPLHEVFRNGDEVKAKVERTDDEEIILLLKSVKSVQQKVDRLEVSENNLEIRKDSHTISQLAEPLEKTLENTDVSDEITETSVKTLKDEYDIFDENEIAHILSCAE